MNFWKSKVEREYLPEIEPPRLLTGIEKMEMEENSKRLDAFESAKSARRIELYARLAEIKGKILPELTEIQKIEAELFPPHVAYGGYQNALLGNNHYGQQLPNGSGPLDAIFGALGRII